MQREFLQEKSLNRKQDNAEKSLNVDLSAKSRLIPYSTAADMLGLNDLYIEERDACQSYRMIFTVNPICTNILYNAVTEPVYLEGSYSAITLIESALTPVLKTNTDIFPDGTMNQSANTESGKIVDQIGAVRDTEYSHEKIGNFKYHCGYDIFNNHLLRTNEFEHVKLADEIREGKKVNEIEFNTIFDYAIDFSGKTVQRVLGESDGPITGATEHEDIRMYQLDTIKSMNTAFYDELRTVDGWFGFYNTGYINIPNGELGPKKEIVSLNKILNNETPCGFVDLYPDRTLYSFLPKVNRFKKRLERNWDCAIVYPYANDEKMFNKVNGLEEGELSVVKVIEARVTHNNVGDEVIEMHSLLRHTLQPGDTIRLYYRGFNDDVPTDMMRCSVPIRVINIGDVNGNNEDRCFTVKYYDIQGFCGIVEREEEPKKQLGLRGPDGEVISLIEFFYRKMEDGCENKYYFRKFKVLKNYEYVSCDEREAEELRPQATTVIKNPTVIDERSPEVISLGGKIYKLTVRPLNYTQSKIAYAENIYGDRIAQVIFNDDIYTAGLKDNLGRPLSSVYFCAVKTNRGHKEWYVGTEKTENKPNATVDEVEFSHCFGEVTSGLDLPMDSGATDYNVRKLYNIFSAYTTFNQDYSAGLELALADAPTGEYSGTPMPIESGITLNDFDELYGDIVEFSKPSFKETVIEKVYHRFNTAQRECLENDKYFDIHYDELVGDLFDVEPTTE